MKGCGDVAVTLGNLGAGESLVGTPTSTTVATKSIVDGTGISIDTSSTELTINNAYSNSTILDCLVTGAQGVHTVVNSSAISSQIDFYTVPAGKRLVIDYFNSSLPSGGANTVAFFVNISGNYYQLTAFNASSATGSLIPYTYIAEEGEIIAYSTTTTSDTNIRIFARLFDNTSALKSVKIPALSMGDNTLYTAPSSTDVFLAGTTFSINTAPILIFNTSGATRTYTINLVPSAGSPSTTNQLSTFTVSNNSNAPSNTTILTSLTEGDFINVNSDSGTAGQFCWINIIEIPV